MNGPKKLPTQINKRLLVQKGRNIEITEEGRQFFEKANVFLKAEDELLSSAQETETVEKVKIGTFETFSTHLLGQKWGDYFPSMGLELHELLPGDMEAAVRSGVVDVGITYEPIPTADLEFLLIGKVQMKIFARRNSFNKVPVEDLPFVAPVAPIRGTPSGVKGLDGWPEHIFPRKVLFKVGMMETGLALARSGQAAIFLAAFVAKAQNQVVSKDYELVEIGLPKKMKPVYRNIYLVLRSSSEENSIVKKLGRLIRKECLD